eukprot:Gb_02929 [translate_table: standard]
MLFGGCLCTFHTHIPLFITNLKFLAQHMKFIFECRIITFI